jgi:L-ascorbate metabolism protein UlaG (beta-lactamase superfamily)
MNSCKSSDLTNKKQVSIQLIRNATLKINFNGKTFLVDPVLTKKNSFTSFVVPNKNLNPTVDLPIPVTDVVKNIDAILVTHMHEDHFFISKEIMNFINPNIPLYAQAFDMEKLSKSDFKNLNFIDLSAKFGETQIIRTTGVHGPGKLAKGLGDVSGFILKAEAYPTVYVVGDCLWDKQIKETIDKYNPDIIITNSGGAEWGGATILMDENSTVELAKYAKNAKVIAVHMEALDHCKTTREKIKRKAQQENVKLIIPEDGEIVKF